MNRTKGTYKSSQRYAHVVTSSTDHTGVVRTMAHPEFVTIRALRLQHHWTFKGLSDMMARAGVRIPHRTLHYLLTKEATLPRARETTLHKLRTFLDYARQHGYLTESPTHEPPALRSHHDTPRKTRRPRLRQEPVPRE